MAILSIPEQRINQLERRLRRGANIADYIVNRVSARCCSGVSESELLQEIRTRYGVDDASSTFRMLIDSCLIVRRAGLVHWVGGVA